MVKFAMEKAGYKETMSRDFVLSLTNQATPHGLLIHARALIRPYSLDLRFIVDALRCF